jgi:hypothetical protein
MSKKRLTEKDESVTLKSITLDQIMCSPFYLLLLVHGFGILSFCIEFECVLKKDELILLISVNGDDGNSDDDFWLKLLVKRVQNLDSIDLF